MTNFQERLKNANDRSKARQEAAANADRTKVDQEQERAQVLRELVDIPQASILQHFRVVA
jgi:hypothetical protein